MEDTCIRFTRRDSHGTSAPLSVRRLCRSLEHLSVQLAEEQLYQTAERSQFTSCCVCVREESVRDEKRWTRDEVRERENPNSEKRERESKSDERSEWS